MNGVFGALAKAIGLAVAKQQAEAAVRRTVRKVALGATMAFFLALAFGFGLAAFTVWLSRRVGVVDALIIVAVAALAIALIVYLIGVLSQKKKPVRRAAVAPPPAAETLADIDIGVTAKTPPAGSELGTMAVIALVGFVLARQLWRR